MQHQDLLFFGEKTASETPFAWNPGEGRDPDSTIASDAVQPSINSTTTTTLLSHPVNHSIYWLTVYKNSVGRFGTGQGVKGPALVCAHAMRLLTEPQAILLNVTVTGMGLAVV